MSPKEFELLADNARLIDKSEMHRNGLIQVVLKVEVFLLNSILYYKEEDQGVDAEQISNARRELVSIIEENANRGKLQ
ncbi:MAG: hypothetical protein Q9223_004325 [Gallowayella weberi]